MENYRTFLGGMTDTMHGPKINSIELKLLVLSIFTAFNYFTSACAYGNESDDIFSKSVILGVNPLTLYEKSKIDPENAYNGPIVDAHNHLVHRAYGDFHSLSIKLGVRKIIAMGRPGSYKQWDTSTFANLPPKDSKIDILCSPDFIGHSYEGDIGKAQDELRIIERKLAAKTCIGIGEVGPIHHNKELNNPSRSGRNQGTIILDLDDWAIDEGIKLAHKYEVPIVFHIEPTFRPYEIDDTDTVKDFYKKKCRKYPNATFVLAHNGMMKPVDLEELFLHCPNLVSDIKMPRGKNEAWKFCTLEIVADRDGILQKRWANLISKYPKRFMYGPDWKMGVRVRHSDEKRRIKFNRRVRVGISSLSKKNQRLLMYENAIRVYKLDID
tara:strand:- start:134 stop:1279 length:1146 start_codon:yes stop_codon:yes gene_type:complete